ncbi:MAG: response regulator transcription factor [Chloroflexi bacterium]|nr:response regulator transcription factor [Chloroflexota bacterium]
MKVLLVDDHALFRAGLATLLQAWGLEVIGEANNGQEAIIKAHQLMPDLILMDIEMPLMNGLEATRAIKSECPDIKVVVLTVSDDENDLFEAIKSGAEGYLLKNLREEEFAEFVGRIINDEPVMSPSLARKLLREFSRLKEEKTRRELDDTLTEREQEVLEQLAGGSSNKDIAAALVISGNTVNFHVKNILSKLHLKNRGQVTAWAIAHGYVSTPAL